MAPAYCSDEDDSEYLPTAEEVCKPQAGGEKEKLAHPIVYFRGTSSSMRPSWDPDANSGIRGVVQTNREGEVRWTSWSIFQGEERWRSEGVQIGGKGSARGVVGSWFDK